MTADATHVIVGASLAGAKAAETLRAEGFAGRVVLIGADAERPYERPPLSKDYLQGEAARDRAFVHDEAFYAEHDIELRPGIRVVGLDVATRQVTLDGGARLGFDRLLLATGARPRRLSLPGAELDGVTYLRTLADCDALRSRWQRGGRVAVVGAGWIGAEVAASARTRGLEVVLIAPGHVPLERVLGTEMGTVYRDVHAEHGVELQLGQSVVAFAGAGSVQGVRLADGRTVACDTVVVGAGVEPRTELAAAAGLAVANGVTVDERLETSVPGIFAAGDVADHRHPHYGASIRTEHWSTALNQGPAAARNMLGAGEPYTRLPYFFSDQYDVGMEYSGYAPGAGAPVVRGDTAAREFIAFWLRDGHVAAAMNVNVWDQTEALQSLIGSRAPVDAQKLADPGVPLADVRT